jgi:heme-degrading monooxygenase HmoA
MHARVSTYSGPADKIDLLAQGLDRLRPELKQLNGFRGAYALVDRNTGKAMTVTLWEDEQAAKNSAENASRMRRKAAEESGQTIESVETYEVAIQI